MNTAKEYIKTLLKLAINNNPEVLKVIRNSKTVVKNATEDAQGNLHSENNGQFVSKGGVNPNYKEELKQVIEKAKNNPNERQKLIIGKVSKDLEKKAKENGFDIAGYEHDLDVSGTRHTLKTHGNEKKENARGQIAITDEDFEKIPDVVYRPDNITFGETDGKNTPLIRYSKRFDDGTVIYVEEIRTRQKTLTIKSMWKQKNIADNSCTFTDFNPQRLEYISNIIITDIQEDFNPDMKKHEVVNDKWITIHPNGEGSKGRPLLLKDGENVYDAMRRQWGISSPGQQHLFSIGKYKTDDSYKRELDAKIAEFNKQFKKSRQEEARRKEEAIETDIQKLEKDAYIIKYANKFGYFGAAEKWDKGHKANNNKENIDMALLDELKKLITKVENDKGEDMDDKEKVKNEKVDKRKLIDEVAGIMKSAGADDEKIRTAIAKMEKLAYDKSEAGTADNACDEDEEEVKNKKVKNEETKKDEEEYKDLKKDVKEDVKNKCKNSVDNAKGGYFDKMNEIYNSAIKPKEENMYISREQKLKNAEEYFAK